MQTFQLKDVQYDVEDGAFLGRGLELTSETLESLEMSGLEASALLYSILILISHNAFSVTFSNLPQQHKNTLLPNWASDQKM